MSPPTTMSGGLINALFKVVVDFHLIGVYMQSMDKRKVATSVFSGPKLNDVEVKYVDEFKYLGHVGLISNNRRNEKDVLC